MAHISNVKVLAGNELALSGSKVSVTGNLTTSGDVTVNGTITANQLNINVTTVTSSVLYSSGSTKFGDTVDDTHQFTGSINLSGNFVLESGYGITGSFSGSGAGLTSLNGSQITTGVVAVGVGGTGQTSYTDGQLLIGNSVGNTLTKNTLTPGSNIGITNGNGTITVSLSSSLTGLTDLNVSTLTASNLLVNTALNASSSLAVSRVTVNAPYTVGALDNVILANVTGSSKLTVTLPSPTAIDGRILTIKRIDAGAGYVEVTCSVNIDDANAYNLHGPYQSITLVADSVTNKWFVV